MTFNLDYQDGQWGWNESSARGADTFHPFKSTSTLKEGVSLPVYGNSNVYTIKNDGRLYYGISCGTHLSRGAWISLTVNGSAVNSTASGAYSCSSVTGEIDVTVGDVITVSISSDSAGAFAGFVL